jgi:hypothetical protein
MKPADWIESAFQVLPLGCKGEEDAGFHVNLVPCACVEKKLQLKSLLKLFNYNLK